LTAGRKKTEWAHGKLRRGWTDYYRQDEHCRIQVDDISDEIVGTQQTSGPQITLPARSRVSQATIRALRLIHADESSAIGAEDGVSFLIFHIQDGSLLKLIANLPQ
jgi:hypothetical protein